MRRVSRARGIIRQALAVGGTVLLVLLSGGSGAVGQDRIQLKQGQSVQGSITKITPLEVTIAVRGKDQNLPLKDIRKISFDKEPIALDRVRDLVLDGKYQQAAEQLLAIPRESLPDDPRIRQDYEFYQWYSEGMRSLAGSGDQSNAIRGLMNLDKSNPNSHHRFSVKLLLGRLALARNVPQRAMEYFNELAQSPEDVQKAAALYYIARTKLELGQPAEARSQLKGLLSAAASSPEMGRYKSLAAVLDARSQLAEGDAEPALQALNELAEREDNTDLPLFAAINNARGACYQALDQPQRAAYSYLQTDLLFFTDAEAHAEALYHLRRLLMAVGEPARAASAGQRLANLYASSSWANKP